MKCTECGSACAKIDVDSTATTTSYQCPSCCNTFERPAPVRSLAAFCAVRDALAAGRIVHAPHPDFGGTVTVGLSVRPGKAPVYETIHHGGTIDTGSECDSVTDAARYFVRQVGKFNALAGARRSA